jgi:hypothetical protein
MDSVGFSLSNETENEGSQLSAHLLSVSIVHEDFLELLVGEGRVWTFKVLAEGVGRRCIVSELVKSIDVV